MGGEAYRKHVLFLKKVVITIGAVLAISGIIMMLLGIQGSDQSTFTIKVRDFEAALSVTYVGLIVIALGVVLIVVAIMTKYGYEETVDLNQPAAPLSSRNEPSASGGGGGGGTRRTKADLGPMKEP